MEFKKQIPFMILEGSLSQIMVSLTTGAFFIAVALEFGASSLVIGFIAALPFLANILQIPGIYLVEKYKDRRTIVFYACAFCRSMLFGIAALYFFTDGSPWLLPLFLLFTSLHFLIGAIAGCAWNSWMNDYIPKPLLSQFFSRRMIWTSSAGAVVTCIASSYLLWWERDNLGDISPYFLFFALAGCLGGMSCLMIRRIHHPPMVSESANAYTKHFSFRQLRIPFRNENFRRLIIFMSIWSFAINLAAPFFTVYMLTTLKIPMSQIILLSIVTQIVYAVTMKIWGKYGEAFSNKAILSICGPLYALCFLGWTFTTFPGPHTYTWLLLLALHVVMGAATSGINLASNNISLKLCPGMQSTLFLSTYSICTSLAAGIAPLLGGALIGTFSDMQLSMNVELLSGESIYTLPTLILSGWDFFFFFAIICAFVALAYLPMVSEEGETNKRVLMRQLVHDGGRFFHNISTISGLKAQTSMPQPNAYHT